MFLYLYAHLDESKFSIRTIKDVCGQDDLFIKGNLLCLPR